MLPEAETPVGKDPAEEGEGCGSVRAVCSYAVSRHTNGSNVVLGPAQQDKLAHIKPNQVLCAITGCDKSASFVLHRYLGSRKPARLAYCDEHARRIARDYRIRIPEYV
jgi:hypothetical protein